MFADNNPGIIRTLANISFKLLQSLGGGSVLGPLMIGGEKPFQIVQMGSSVSDIVNSASIAAYNAIYSK
jgi:malate dehydrogenase (oxaloacetate-decarboxylating)(NADP+)